MLVNFDELASSNETLTTQVTFLHRALIGVENRVNEGANAIITAGAISQVDVMLQSIVNRVLCHCVVGQ